MSAPHRFVVTALILLSLILSGCDGQDSTSTPSPSPTPDWCHADFGDLIPTGWVLDRLNALDTDGDSKTECVVLYRLGPTRQVEPVRGVVYRRDHGGTTRWVCPYPLKPPKDYYLGEHEVTARVADILSGSKGPELIIEDKDSNGTVIEASIFGWDDPMKNDPDAPCDPNKMHYQLLGWFMGEGGVTIRMDRVVVVERIRMARCGLAHQRTYVPSEKTRFYYNNPEDTSALVALAETEMVSLLGDTAPGVVCYPEKTVLDFYQHVKDDTYLKELMAEGAFDDLKAGKLPYGCSPDRTLLDRVLVQDLKIQGTEDQPQIVASGKCKYKDGTTKDMTPITWRLEKIEGRWRIKRPK